MNVSSIFNAVTTATVTTATVTNKTKTENDNNTTKQLRAKVVESFKTDHRNLLRAFRGVTRYNGLHLLSMPVFSLPLA